MKKHAFVFFKRVSLVALLFLVPLFQGQRIHVSPDSRMKAVFLMNFTRFIGWTNLDTADTFTIGVYGLNEILIPLKQMSRERKSSGQSVVVERISDQEQIATCDIVFVPFNQADEFHNMRPSVPNKNILYVGESLGFATSDGAINFIKRDGKIKLEINRTALAAANLVASSHLLKLAHLVGEDVETISE